MDEILELQRQLAEVQLGSSSNQLSERNCVELVMKLQSLKLVDLIFTRSGKEYLTHRQLSEEIEDEILTRGGMWKRALRIISVCSRHKFH